MLNAETKRRIDSCRDILVGKVPDPKAQVEQITTALLYKFMDDMDAESESIGGKPSFFIGDLKKFRWSKLLSKQLSGQERWDVFTQATVAFGKAEALPKLFRDIFVSAYIPYRDPETLNLFLKEVDGFTYEHSEDLGDAYEYLLSILGSQGDAGQFRTPRHIIDFIVHCVDPDIHNTILDPACGTAGFLISAYKHILEKYRVGGGIPATTIPGTTKQGGKDATPHTISKKEREQLIKNLTGYDISPDMVRISKVNMYLHGFPVPSIFEYDTLTSEDRWKDSFDVILANPPFMTPKGGVRPHSKFSLQANRTEVLFSDYIMEHLKPGGRAGFIVPEGIIFQSANAYKELRKRLVEDYGLFCVVSLPAGVFQPYSGVKTSIILLDKNLAKSVDSILFVKVENDGFDLGAQRRPIDKNDLPKALKTIREYVGPGGKDATLHADNATSRVGGGIPATTIPTLTATREKIKASGDYNLSMDRYRETLARGAQKWPMVKLGEVCDLYQPTTISAKDLVENGEFEVFGANGVIGKYNEYNHEFPEVVVTCRGATCGTVNMTTPKAWITGNAMVVKPRDEAVQRSFLYYMLTSSDLKGVISGSAQPQITRTTFSPFEIPLPPLEVQQALVAELERYRKMIDGARAIIDNYKPEIEIDPSWEVKELGEVCEEIFAGGDVPSEYSKVKEADFRYPIFTNGIGEKSLYGFAKKARVDRPCVTISARGTIGYPEVRRVPFYPAIRLIVARPNTDIMDVAFLKYALESIEIGRTGNTIPQLTVPMVKSELIPVPDLSEQRAIVARLESERSEIESLKSLVARLEAKIKQKVAALWE